MNILLVSWYFPPVNDVAAIRTGAMAEHLLAAGHDVHVLTAQRGGGLQAKTFPEERVTRTNWFDVDSVFRRRPAEASGGGVPSPSDKKSKSRIGPGVRLALESIYADIWHIPDRQRGWYREGLAAGRDLVARHRIELIYASAPPFTTFFLSRALAKTAGIPWIAEYRDGWAGEVHNPRAAWRRAIDSVLERRVVGAAAGIVAVSEPWADYYRGKFRKPTAAIYNGIDAAVAEPVSLGAPGTPLKISYFGSLYDGLRDPSRLYAAIKQSNLTPADVHVCFYGPAADEVLPLAELHGVADYVEIHGRVSREDSLRNQRESDVLLLLQPSQDMRNVPAKVFEYFGSRRPILGIGLDAGIPARLINERHAGLYASDVGKVANQLRDWVCRKRQCGRIDDLPPSALEGLSRVDQLTKLDSFLDSFTQSPIKSGA